MKDVLLWGWIDERPPALSFGTSRVCARTSASEVRLLRDAGALAALPKLTSPIWRIATAWMGDFAGAASLIAETDSVAAATGSRPGTLRLVEGSRHCKGGKLRPPHPIASAIELAAPGGQGMASALRRTGRPLSSTTGSAATRRRRPRPGRPARTPSSWWSRCGCCPGWSRPACAEGDAELARGAPERLAEDSALPHRLRARHRGAFRALLTEGRAAEVCTAKRSTARPGPLAARARPGAPALR